jgi:carbonic anhydrase/acetyltransferase-like protein (isoleucine patch superfamily)
MLNLSFKLTEETRIAPNGETLYRIEATRNIPTHGVHKGDRGGFVASLEVNGQARIGGDAWVYDNAFIYGDALVSGDAQVSGSAQVSDNARVYGNAWVYGDARVFAVTEIINFIIAFGFSVTITPDNIAIGCQLKTREEWLKMTKKQAIGMGLLGESYAHYKELIKVGMKMVPARKA